MDSLILSIETATLGGSVCVSAGDKLLATTAGDPALSHSNTLLSDINRCLELANAKVHDVQAFAAASGPGSFTGLRIGLATIKALAATLDRPCIGVPTLQAIAHSAGPSDATVSLLPAGRGEVFVQLLSVRGEVGELDEAGHLPPARAVERYVNRAALKWVGTAARTHRGLIESAARARKINFHVVAVGEPEASINGWQLVESETSLAAQVAAIAWRRFQNSEFERAENLSAIYVRPSDAELKCHPA
jgi:tRNA threonylcarbamoyladenosine biosynthesis protein TsaB